ncbi:hypothetical protein ACFFGT_16060 [Mucilaginibacter angelicae]|uniref:Uncharacterized protein n=1 Tax=Mucilaginibacter angelicae TaxID=869718 RepID=A0ABV6L8D3_9SPHI
MKKMLFYLLMITFSAQAKPGQKRINPKKLKMIAFLVKHNDLTPFQKDNLNDYDDAIYERAIYDKRSTMLLAFSAPCRRIQKNT